MTRLAVDQLDPGVDTEQVSTPQSQDPMSNVSNELAALETRAVDVSPVLKALGNARRLVILCRLATHGEMSVSALMAEVNLSQSALSQHLARMRREGLVGTRRDGQTIWYRIADPRLRPLLSKLCEIYCAD